MNEASFLLRADWETPSLELTRNPTYAVKNPLEPTPAAAEESH